MPLRVGRARVGVSPRMLARDELRSSAGALSGRSLRPGKTEVSASSARRPVFVPGERPTPELGDVRFPARSRSAPVPSPVPRLSAEAHGTGEPPPCRSQLRWQAKARVPRFDEGHIAAVLHDGVRGYAAVSPVEPLSSSARFAALVGSPEVTPRGLRHHPGWRPRARVAIFAPGGVVEQSVVRCPRRARTQRARIEAPRGIRSGDGPYADRRAPRGL